MKIISNIIWFFLGGIWLFLAWCLFGLVLCLTIVGIPFAKQCFKIAVLSLMPYGKKVVLDYSKHPVANLLWVVFFGWELGLIHLFAGIINCITVIGIPSGIQCFKIMKLAFFPFGAKIK